MKSIFDLFKKDTKPVELPESKVNELVFYAESVINGDMAIGYGSVKIEEMLFELEIRENKDYRIFIALNSETDSYPVEDARQYWNIQSINEKDRSLKEIEEQYKSEIVEACEKIVSKYKKNSGTA